MGRLRRGHSLEVIFEEETTQFQPSIARLEEEEYKRNFFFQKIYPVVVFWYYFCIRTGRKGDTHKRVEFLSTHTKNRTSHLFLFRLWTIESFGNLILFLLFSCTYITIPMGYFRLFVTQFIDWLFFFLFLFFLLLLGRTQKEFFISLMDISLFCFWYIDWPMSGKTTVDWADVKFYSNNKENSTRNHLLLSGWPSVRSVAFRQKWIAIQRRWIKLQRHTFQLDAAIRLIWHWLAPMPSAKEPWLVASVKCLKRNPFVKRNRCSAGLKSNSKFKPLD